MSVNLFEIRAAQCVNNYQLPKPIGGNFAKESCSFNYNTNRPATKTPEALRAFIPNRNADCIDYLA